jgi:hypothetical protein
MKTDFSDWCIDETLLQLMNNVWRLCVYYSKKNASAECNYEIYDKRCWSSYNVWKSEMQNWEVCQVFRFVQITRIWNTLWQLKAYRATNEVVFILSQYNFFILYLSENQNERADALSRHEQDMLTDLSDDRVQHCTMQIIHLKWWASLYRLPQWQ